MYKAIKGRYDSNKVIFKRCKFSKRPNLMQLQQIIVIFVCIKGELTNLKKMIIIIYFCPKEEGFMPYGYLTGLYTLACYIQTVYLVQRSPVSPAN